MVGTEREQPGSGLVQMVGGSWKGVGSKGGAGEPEKERKEREGGALSSGTITASPTTSLPPLFWMQPSGSLLPAFDSAFLYLRSFFWFSFSPPLLLLLLSSSFSFLFLLSVLSALLSSLFFQNPNPFPLPHTNNHQCNLFYSISLLFGENKFLLLSSSLKHHRKKQGA